MSNSCSFDCKYCANAAACKNKKVSYEPQELANVFMHLVKKIGVHGLFLSSAINRDADKTTEKMLSAVRLIRFKYNFKGYIHFKILPGTSYELIKQSSELSDRMSINIEAPNKSILLELSSCKDYKNDILTRQAWIKNLSKNQTTQFIVNSFSTDKDILKMLKWEYEKLKLSRIYFSAFRPIKGTALENEKPEKLSRQNHLYNIDFLIRKYDFSFKEIEKSLIEDMLPNEDPKLAIAKSNFDKPLDINQASYEELLRIPGIGPTTAKRIIELRRNKKQKINSYNDLSKLGGYTKRALPFIKINGKTQKMLSDY